ncbi:hypothetical protein BM221_004450 [Beauveria bassiana]|uniref:Uncharacterized protein n=1 Tax=Beauveria bassiana TaxID=176275 RepID=A0A2N6NRB5_BEABA|nr:hypothetical protein BM221_010851 [Beauveria bassiana]PMB69803.1 hypothetical protein BM221_004450 [Beauveria bassiana]
MKAAPLLLAGLAGLALAGPIRERQNTSNVLSRGAAKHSAKLGELCYDISSCESGLTLPLSEEDQTCQEWSGGKQQQQQQQNQNGSGDVNANTNTDATNGGESGESVDDTPRPPPLPSGFPEIPPLIHNINDGIGSTTATEPSHPEQQQNQNGSGDADTNTDATNDGESEEADDNANASTERPPRVQGESCTESKQCAVGLECGWEKATLPVVGQCELPKDTQQQQNQNGSGDVNANTDGIKGTSAPVEQPKPQEPVSVKEETEGLGCRPPVANSTSTKQNQAHGATVLPSNVASNVDPSTSTKSLDSWGPLPTKGQGR